MIYGFLDRLELAPAPLPLLKNRKENKGEFLSDFLERPDLVDVVTSTIENDKSCSKLPFHLRGFEQKEPVSSSIRANSSVSVSKFVLSESFMKSVKETSNLVMASGLLSENEVPPQNLMKLKEGVLAVLKKLQNDI